MDNIRYQRLFVKRILLFVNHLFRTLYDPTLFVTPLFSVSNTFPHFLHRANPIERIPRIEVGFVLDFKPVKLSHFWIHKVKISHKKDLSKEFCVIVKVCTHPLVPYSWRPSVGLIFNYTNIPHLPEWSREKIKKVFFDKSVSLLYIVSMIPKVRTWKVRVVETGQILLIDTINRRFARMIAIHDYGMWGKTLKVSLSK